MEECANCVQFSRPCTGEVAWRGGLATYIVQSWQGEENRMTLFFLRDRIGSGGITHSGDPLHTFHRSNKICITQEATSINHCSMSGSANLSNSCCSQSKHTEQERAEDQSMEVTMIRVHV